MRAMALCLLWLPPLAARDPAPAITLPAEVKARPAEITELKAQTAGQKVKWVVLTPGLSVRPIDGGKTLLFSGPTGRYELIAYTAAGDVPSDPARCVVVIEGEAPPPAPDPLRVRLAAALAIDKAAKADVLQLAAIYREAAKLVTDPEVSTSKELLSRLRQVSAALIGPGTLPSVRGVVAEELLAVLGMSSEETLTAAQRKKAAELFTRLAALLEEVVK
jgi:hypothetical protein